MYATILSLSYQSRSHERVTAERVRLIAGHGIDGDRKAGRHPARHLNIIDRESLARLTGDRITPTPGQLGEQIIIAALDLAALPCGTRLRLGTSAIVEITMLRDGCARYGLNGAIGEMPLGVMARVLEGGMLAVGDRVCIEQPQPIAF